MIEVVRNSVLVAVSVMMVLLCSTTLYAQDVVWEVQDFPYRTHRSFTDIEVDKQGNGVVVSAYGGVMYTTNGGADWDFGVDSLAEEDLHWVQQLGSNTWMVGGFGMWKSVDGGRTWTKLRDSYVGDAAFVDSLNGVIVTLDSVFLTKDGGASFENITSTIGFSLLTCNMNSDGMVIVGGVGNRIAISTNWGSEWTPFETTYDITYSCYLLSNSRIVSNGRTTTETSVMMISRDGARTWSRVEPGFWVTDTDFVDSLVGYAVGQNGHISLTFDGGLTWRAKNTESIVDFNAVCAVNADTLFVVGDGLIARTNNARDLISGVEPTNTEHELSVVAIPNPTTDKLDITLPTYCVSPVTVSVYSVDGKQVCCLDNVFSKVSIDVSAWVTGMYYLVLQDDVYANSTIVQVVH